MRMAIERVFHCDWRDCEGHVRTVSTRPSAGFLTVSEADGGRALHFCTWDCLLRFAGEKSPVEVVAFDAD